MKKKKIQFIVPRAAGQDSKPPTETGLQSNQLQTRLRDETYGRPILTGIISIRREIMHRTAFVQNLYTTIYTYIYVPIQVHSNLYVCCGIKVLLNGNKFCPRLKVWPEVFGQIGAVRSACLLVCCLATRHRRRANNDNNNSGKINNNKSNTKSATAIELSSIH